jgi:hypothetical protein
MALPETFQRLASFLEVSELIDVDERAVFLRLLKRVTSEEDIDTRLQGWTALSTDAVWFKSRAYEILQREIDSRSKYQKKTFGEVDDKNTPKWQVEARLESQPEWVDLNRRVHVATQLQIIADKVCEITMSSLKVLEALGNNARFYGRVETQNP